MPKILWIALYVIAGIVAINVASHWDQRNLYSTGRSLERLSLTSHFDSSKTLELEDLKGKYTILNFYASWCTACIAEHDSLIYMSKNPLLKSGKVNFVGVNLHEKDYSQGKKMIEDMGNPYSFVGVSNLPNLYIDLGIKAMPETMIINPELEIVMHYRGPLTLRVVDKTILGFLQKSLNEPITQN